MLLPPVPTRSKPVRRSSVGATASNPSWNEEEEEEAEARLAPPRAGSEVEPEGEGEPTKKSTKELEALRSLGGSSEGSSMRGWWPWGSASARASGRASALPSETLAADHKNFEQQF
jgi:hypothetical protein